MLERRSSDRKSLGRIMVKEENGEYLFSYRARDLSEEGMFLENRLCVSNQEPYSRLTFVLPNGKAFRNLTARIVREDKKQHRGCAYEFLNLSEETRLELKRFLAAA